MRDDNGLLAASILAQGIRLICFPPILLQGWELKMREMGVFDRACVVGFLFSAFQLRFP